ncbi:hypothetical protein [Lysobacter enzymogenes]|uniref:hypothetical protein n=1 Tax=Lysobacter enzymogenes TaxID=69 RepID=UPI001A9705B0|nr:hypothetical protein [Lysobacter enzymogenes]QQP96626.1 hypothetical protein JHW38_00785 [Lysobacter enzymogenes]
MPTPDWLPHTQDLPSLQANLCFLIHDRFYYGPDHPADPNDLERLTVPLSAPRIPVAHATVVTAAEALGHERELADYYRQIVRLAREHGRPFNSIRHCFWLRLWLWNADRQTSVSFPWYDSYSEIDRVLKALAETDSGEVFYDVEQGWDMKIHAQDGAVYFLESDPDDDDAQLAIRVPREPLVQQVRALRESAQALIARLTEELGADVWTSYVRTEPVFKP